MTPDLTGRALATELQARAQPGVEVRVFRGFCIDRHDDYVDVHVAHKHEELSDRVWLRGGPLSDVIPECVETMENLTFDVWADGLSLSPDGDDVRERSYAIANAVDMTDAQETDTQ